MNRDGSLTRAWADGTYTFRLAWGELIMLQEATDCGPFVLLQRMAIGGWLVQEIAHIVRLGLIGGGMDPVPALKLVEAYVEKRPPLENTELAIKILSEGIGMGDEEDDVLKKKRKSDDGPTNPPLPKGKVRVGDLYGSGAVMGFTPQEVNKMSMFQFMAVAEGYSSAHETPEPGAMSNAEQDDIWAWMQTKN